MGFYRPPGRPDDNLRLAVTGKQGQVARALAEAGAALRDEPLFGVVHAAWPGVPHGGLLQAPDEAIRQQLDFGTTQTVRLARFLYAHAGPAGGRLVALGSIFGSQKPTLTLAPYSLGKAALEATVRLLAPELARKQVAVNAVCPSSLWILRLGRAAKSNWIT